MTVCGIDTTDEDRLYDIRQQVGMVFQNPDNQIVATDRRGGRGVRAGEPGRRRRRRSAAGWTRRLQTWACTSTGTHAPHQLSGGQKQRVAIAGIIAMRPRLHRARRADRHARPQGPPRGLETRSSALNREYGITVVLITHYMDEAGAGGPGGRDGRRRDPPGRRRRERCSPTCRSSRRSGWTCRRPPSCCYAAAAGGVRPAGRHPHRGGVPSRPSRTLLRKKDSGRQMIAIKTERAHLHLFGRHALPEDGHRRCQPRDRAGGVRRRHRAHRLGQIDPHPALQRAVEAHLGPGAASTGRTSGPRQDQILREYRFKVGLVFQYPEYQLFEETVYKDIAFGPNNMGLSPEEIDERVREAADFVGLREEHARQKSPFELSGGQKRRVAIAGVLAMDPEVLDPRRADRRARPQGARHDPRPDQGATTEERDNTVLLVSHSMEDVAQLRATRCWC